MIELRHISKIFPTADGDFQALSDVSLTIQDGDIFGIVGMSGAGKSTLVRCINLLERPTEGQVLMDGILETKDGGPVDLCSLSPAQLRQARRSISMIFQQFNLLMQRTCLNNICFPMEIAGVPRAEAKKRALEYLDTLSLQIFHNGFVVDNRPQSKDLLVLCFNQLIDLIDCTSHTETKTGMFGNLHYH